MENDVKNDVVLTVISRQWDAEGVSNRTETRYKGSAYGKNGAAYFLYEEEMEGADGVVKNMIRLNGDSVELTRRGGVSVKMVFREGETSRCSYVTPFGTMTMDVQTLRMQAISDRECTEISLHYHLLAEDNIISKCKMKIMIKNTNQ